MAYTNVQLTTLEWYSALNIIAVSKIQHIYSNIEYDLMI